MANIPTNLLFINFYQKVRGEGELGSSERDHTPAFYSRLQSLDQAEVLGEREALNWIRV